MGKYVVIYHNSVKVNANTSVGLIPTTYIGVNYESFDSIDEAYRFALENHGEVIRSAVQSVDIKEPNDV